jgi:hypothetical protein
VRDFHPCINHPASPPHKLATIHAKTRSNARL